MFSSHKNRYSSHLELERCFGVLRSEFQLLTTSGTWRAHGVSGGLFLEFGLMSIVSNRERLRRLGHFEGRHAHAAAGLTLLPSNGVFQVAVPTRDHGRPRQCLCKLPAL